MDAQSAKLLESYRARRETLLAQGAKFAQVQEEYREYIDALFSEIEFELVLYDEVEYFKKYDNSEFDYPYSKRKTKLGSFSFNITISADYDYSYFSKAISFQLSQTCLEQNPLLVHTDFVNGARKLRQPGAASQESDFWGDCSNEKYAKLKYLKYADAEKYYLNDYEIKFFTDKFLLEVVLVLDPFKTINTRDST